MRSRRRAFALVLALAVVPPGCAATREWIYDKPRVTPAQLDHDMAECRKVARSRSMFRTIEEEKVDRPAFNRCMQRRGYTVTDAPLR